MMNYKITYIGTMGAYFVLAKDEKNQENLQDYGVKLLEEKHKTYITIFQTQTEAMLSQDKAQCIVQADMPETDYPPGTRWLDTDNNPVRLMELQEVDRVNKWVEIQAEVKEDERGAYENYQRYIDNYEKLQAVQKVLVEKKNAAEYALGGHEVPDRSISLTSGQSITAQMHGAASAHFNGYAVTMVSMNSVYPSYTFTTSFDPIIYVKIDTTKESYNYFKQYYVKQNYIPIAINNSVEFMQYDGSTEEKTLYLASSTKPRLTRKTVRVLIILLRSIM